MKSLDTLEFEPRFARLGDAFSAVIKPSAIEQPQMVICSQSALALLDLPASTADDPRLLQLVSGEWYWPNVAPRAMVYRSEEHTSELQSRPHLVCRLLLEKKKKT